MKKFTMIFCVVFIIIIIAVIFVNSFAFVCELPVTTIESTTDTEDKTENIILSGNYIEEYAKDFPVITKATLYKNGIPEEISPDDTRIIGMVNYIMKSYNERSYSYITGVLESRTIEDYYVSQAKAYMELELNSVSSNELSKYNRAIVSFADVIMIDDNSVSYHGEGNPFNFCFSPYNTGGVPVAPILYLCGLVNDTQPYKEN